MTAAATPPQRWYQRHHQAVTDQRNDIEVLREQLATAPNRDAVVMLCVAGQQSERPEYERARQARDVHTAWAEAVDLTRWMVASCSGVTSAASRRSFPCSTKRWPDSTVGRRSPPPVDQGARWARHRVRHGRDRSA